MLVFYFVFMTSFKELTDLMAFMRGPQGCAWDREQTLDDFKVHFLNESQEVLDALEKGDYENLKEELGDVLWHILFMSQVAKERGLFTIDDVLAGLNDKIVRRHPHVFGDAKKLKTSEEVIREYKKIKALEKKRK
jgi:tetrapyrrole methylase family protein / MazG family protein